MPLEYQTDAELEASTNRWMAVGAGLLIVMALVFPFYRWYEPASRDDARDTQAASLAAEGENVWQFNCDNWLSDRIFGTCDDIVAQCCEAWNKLIDQPWHHDNRHAQPSAIFRVWWRRW